MVTMNTSKRTTILIIIMIILAAILFIQTINKSKTPSNVNRPLGKGYELSPDILEDTLNEIDF